MQLDLFDSRRLRLSRGRQALEDFDLPTAIRALSEYQASYPNDDAGLTDLSRAKFLAKRLTELEVQKTDRVRALLALADEIEGLATGWHRCLAAEAERQWGIGCDVDGNPVGLYWQLGGDLEQAERSLHVSVERRPRDGQLRVYLANVLFARNERELARRDYLRGFLLSPGTIEIETIADTEVKELADVARFEYEVPGEPKDWVAAVGVVEGVFPVPVSKLPGFEGLSAETESAGSGFYRTMLAERAARRHEEKVRLRAMMKRLCPVLFAAYLERFR